MFQSLQHIFDTAQRFGGFITLLLFLLSNSKLLFVAKTQRFWSLHLEAVCYIIYRELFT